MIMLLLVCYHQDTDRTRCVSGWGDLSRTEIVTMSVTETVGTATVVTAAVTTGRLQEWGRSGWVGGWVCEWWDGG